MAARETVILPSDLDTALREAVRAVVEIAHPRAVILFGSWAEGTARDDSDVDLLVVAEAENRPLLAARLRHELRPLLAPRPVHLIVYRPEQWESGRRVIGFVTYEADNYGVKLYDRAA
jgi:predicted nucleotidyltransferase